MSPLFDHLDVKIITTNLTMKYANISANTDGTCVTVPHAHLNVVQYTQLDVKCDQKLVIIVDCRSHLPLGHRCQMAL